MNAINQVLILSLMMLIGIYARKKNYIDDRVEKGISTLMVNITLPLMIVNSFILKFDKEIIGNVSKVFFYSLIIHTVLLLLSKLIYKKIESRKKVLLIFATAFSNCGFMGFPILNNIYGEIGVFYGSIFLMVFTAFVWTLGVALFTGDISFKSAVKDIIKNPSMIAVFVGAIIFVGQVKLPYPLAETIKTIGGLTTPLSMIIIGSMLATSDVKAMMGDYTLYILSIIRLIVVPIVTFAIMKFFNVDIMLRAVCTILVAMPAGAIAPVIAIDNNGDGVYGSQCVFITTVLSVITIPFFINLVG